MIFQILGERLHFWCVMTKKKVYVLTSTFLWSVKATKVCSKWHKQISKLTYVTTKFRAIVT